MLRIYVNYNVLFIFLLIISTIDTSRILYFPLLKIHSPHEEFKSVPIKQQSSKPSHEKRYLRKEFLPLSAMERPIYEVEDDDDGKRETIDWESLLDKKARHHLTVNERSRGNERLSDYILSSDQDMQRLSKPNLPDNLDDSIDKLAKLDENRHLNEPWIADKATGQPARLQSDEALEDLERRKRRNDVLFLAIVGTCSLVGVVGLVAAAIFWYRIQKKAEAALDAEYPSYGVTGPGGSGAKISPSSTISDRKLAQSAQMFHYQQQRQQMMAQEKAHLDTKPVHSDDSDDEAPNGGDYTVYECPGLAPTGEMEVRNPLFSEPDSSVFASHPTTNNHYPQPTTSSPSSSSPPKEKSLS